MVWSTSLAQVRLESFQPRALPDTQMPKPVPKEMVALPSGISFSGSCLPQVKGVLIPSLPLSGFQSPEVAEKIRLIVVLDQTPRLKGTLNEHNILDDQHRREQLRTLVAKARTSADFSGIALVFQHGDCTDHYLFANRMAELGMKLAMTTADYERAAWLYAATLDRALQSAGKAQKYGTQYWGMNGECPRLYVVDPHTTDAERHRLAVPTLQQALQNADRFRTLGCTSR